MHGNIPFGVASATEIARRQCQQPSGDDARVSRIPLFGAAARLAWPFKTAAHVAAIARTSERHAARMLAGEFDAPAPVLAALLVELTKRN
jgi:hypothetical protein